ncbi:MAG: glycosyltransferase N-terminal domain-containing protein [Gemmatimonadaceae bacterium]
MNPIIRIPYGAAGAIARLAVAIAPERETKLLRAISARRGLLDRYEAWAREHRHFDAPLLWVHAPSVGEGLQALPVVQRFRARHPDAQVVFTYFSPSAEKFANTVGADFADYLPFDTEDNAVRALNILKPTAIVFSKLDVWPILVEKAAEAGVKTGLLSATVPEASNRRSGLALMALREAYGLLDTVGAISPADAERLLAMGVRPDRMNVTGDTRYDQVWTKANTSSETRDTLVARYEDPRPTLVAGSTWPSDEKRLLPGWLQMRRMLPAARLIIAPHEMTPTRLSAIEAWAAASSLTLSRTSEPTARATEVVLVDQFGILGDLYSLATAAFVGGGFHDAGLHSMLEPAAFGAPVLIGPMHTDNRDAGLLVAGGGAVRCAGPGDISARIQVWFKNSSVLAKASASARRVVEAGIGAADRSTELVEALLHQA